MIENAVDVQKKKATQSPFQSRDVVVPKHAWQ
jgi:hypothetical protein